MKKRDLKWLNGIALAYNASESFLNAMNDALRKEYTEKTETTFNILHLFVERISDLVYLPDQNSAEVTGQIEVGRTNNWGNCRAAWRLKTGERLIRPSDEVKADEIEFQWLELDLPQVPPRPGATLSLAQQLAPDAPYELIAEAGLSGLDLDLSVQLTHPAPDPALTQRLGDLQNQWNQQAEADPSGRKGLIHNVYYVGQDEDRYIFRVDMGSAGVEGLKHLLQAFNDPVWGVRRVEITT